MIEYAHHAIFISKKLFFIIIFQCFKQILVLSPSYYLPIHYSTSQQTDVESLNYFSHAHFNTFQEGEKNE
jgi:hypothetical protein